MRILLWHGYLLGGTGSNVYTRSIAREWSLAGHDVTVVCQERHPERYDLGGARVVVPGAARRAAARLRPRPSTRGSRRGCSADFTPEERDAYVEANAAALRELGPADLVFANHVLLGAPGRRRERDARTASRRTARSSSTRCAAGPTSRAGEPRRSPRAEVVYAGSEHIRDVLDEVCGHVDRVEIVPPGVDVDEFRPEPREEALAALLEEARADPPNPATRGAASRRGQRRALRATSSREEQPTVLYFGKLIENKGVQVLLEALAGLDARAVVVGFGDYREQLEALAPPGTLFTGPLEHRHLRHLLPLCDVAVVPSIFPEAFGMVAAEAAAAGVLPVVSAHSGLAEVAAGIGEEVGPEACRAPLVPGRRRRRAARPPRRDPRPPGRAPTRAWPRGPPRRRAAAGAGRSSPRACST